MSARVRNRPTKSMPGKPASSKDKVRAHRERMRRKGMKLIQIWVPDPKSPAFKKEARRQARLVANSPMEKEDQAFVDAISWLNRESAE
ncbi:MAG TPA: antitoxin MazE family protein [Rhizomicrobium sp.]|nr:antitoxin MazE family protein [Rhizomicrobium sp.]